MTRVLVLFGGRSAEHEVSCLSATSVLEVIDRDRYEVITVGITRDGRWTLTDGVPPAAGPRRLPSVDPDGPTAALVGTRSGPQLVLLGDDGGRVASLGRIDVAFPVLHGPWGEDGTVQGMLATVGVPYVGADVTASSIGIDKGAMKAAFAAAGLPQLGYLTVHRARWESEADAVLTELLDRLPLPWFVKPARQGSSIGISKVSSISELDAAMAEAFAYDDVAVVEKGLIGARELEVGVLGDADMAVTRPGEIVPSHEFYDFEAKYLNTSELRIPAQVPDEVEQRCVALARRAFRAIGCRGLARVDLFLDVDGKLVVNEINTIPGFTPASMFPMLWAAEGVSYPDLVDRLLASARA
ncbi:MAG: D-alanine--D-alanine ligase family protein [Nitriliruptoraceae bacterium]